MNKAIGQNAISLCMYDVLEFYLVSELCQFRRMSSLCTLSFSFFPSRLLLTSLL